MFPFVTSRKKVNNSFLKCALSRSEVIYIMEKSWVTSFITGIATWSNMKKEILYVLESSQNKDCKKNVPCGVQFSHVFSENFRASVSYNLEETLIIQN